MKTQKNSERLKLISLAAVIFLFFGTCSFDSGGSGESVEKKPGFQLSAYYSEGFATVRWNPVLPVKIKFKYEEGAKTDWEYVKITAGNNEETNGKTQEIDTFDSGELKFPVFPDRVVLIQAEGENSESNIVELRTLSQPEIYISSYDDLTFRLEISVSPYAEKLILERRKDGESKWERIKEIDVKEGKIVLDDKVPSEGVWFYRARVGNRYGTSSWSREFFASPVVCFARRSSPRISGKAAGCGWAYRRTITVQNNSTPESDVVVRVVLDTATLISAGKMKADCSDVRFTDQSDEIFLPYWIGIDRNGNSTCNTSQTTFWVKIYYLQSGANTIYMYYGNENADPVSDPKKVFVFYDDMEAYSDGQRPPPGWQTLGSGILEAHNDGGNMVIVKGCADPTSAGCSPAGGGNDPNGGYHLFPFPVSNFIAMWRIKRVNITSGNLDRVNLEDLNYDGYGFYEGTNIDEIRIEERNNGSGTVLTSQSVILTDTGEWNLFVFYKRGGVLTGEFTYSGGTVTISASSNITNVVFDRIAIRGGRDYYVDDIAVAKYADVSVSVGAETSASYTGLFLRRIPLTLNSSSELRDFSVRFEIPLTEPITTGKIRDDCGDLRFSDSPYFEVDLWGLSFPYYFEARGPCGGDSALSGWWKFDEGTGTSASDSSGNGNTGTLSAGAGWGEGKYGSGVDLRVDGTTDYVTLPGSVLNGKTAVSVSVWVKWTKGDNQGNASILSAGNASQADEFLIYKMGAAGNDSFRLYVKGQFRTISAGVNLEDGNWHHIVVVWRSTGASSSVAWLYVDGVLRGSATYTVGGALSVDCAVVGQETDSVSGSTCGGFDPLQEWEGYIDDLRIFGRELSPYEAKMLYEGKAGVWVKLPYIQIGNQTLYAYFGNSSKTSVASGDKVFEFFDDFEGTSLNTAKWTPNSSAYSVNYGVLIQTGNLVSKYSVAHSNVGRTFEILARWRNSNADYAGINIADDNRTAGSNTQADCVAYWMTEAGDGPSGPTEYLRLYGAEGDTTGYDVVGATLYTISEFVWYIGGFRFDFSNFYFFIQDGLYTSLNSLNYAGQWKGDPNDTPGSGDQSPESEPGAPYLFLGCYLGLNCGNTTDIDDIEVMWVRVRKDGTQPTISYGTMEDSTE